MFHDNDQRRRNDEDDAVFLKQAKKLLALQTRERLTGDRILYTHLSASERDRFVSAYQSRHRTRRLPIFPHAGETEADQIMRRLSRQFGATLDESVAEDASDPAPAYPQDPPRPRQEQEPYNLHPETHLPHRQWQSRHPSNSEGIVNVDNRPSLYHPHNAAFHHQSNASNYYNYPQATIPQNDDRMKQTWPPSAAYGVAQHDAHFVQHEAREMYPTQHFRGDSREELRWRHREQDFEHVVDEQDEGGFGRKSEARKGSKDKSKRKQRRKDAYVRPLEDEEDDEEDSESDTDSYQTKDTRESRTHRRRSSRMDSPKSILKQNREKDVVIVRPFEVSKKKEGDVAQIVQILPTPRSEKETSGGSTDHKLDTVKTESMTRQRLMEEIEYTRRMRASVSTPRELAAIQSHLDALKRHLETLTSTTGGWHGHDAQPQLATDKAHHHDKSERVKQTTTNSSGIDHDNRRDIDRRGRKTTGRGHDEPRIEFDNTAVLQENRLQPPFELPTKKHAIELGNNHMSTKRENQHPQYDRPRPHHPPRHDSRKSHAIPRIVRMDLKQNIDDFSSIAVEQSTKETVPKVKQDTPEIKIVAPTDLPAGYELPTEFNGRSGKSVVVSGQQQRNVLN